MREPQDIKGGKGKKGRGRKDVMRREGGL